MTDQIQIAGPENGGPDHLRIHILINNDEKEINALAMIKNIQANICIPKKA